MEEEACFMQTMCSYPRKCQFHGDAGAEITSEPQVRLDINSKEGLKKVKWNTHVRSVDIKDGYSISHELSSDNYIHCQLCPAANLLY